VVGADYWLKADLAEIIADRLIPYMSGPKAAKYQMLVGVPEVAA
jgi:hypothetical protein